MLRRLRRYRQRRCPFFRRTRSPHRTYALPLVAPSQAAREGPARGPFLECSAASADIGRGAALSFVVHAVLIGLTLYLSSRPHKQLEKDLRAVTFLNAPPPPPISAEALPFLSSYTQSSSDLRSTSRRALTSSSRRTCARSLS